MPDREWLYPNLRENGYTYSVLENLHYIPHVHGGLECVYVLDGELCATIDEKNYTLKKGDVCLIFPQVRHSYRTPKHSNSFCFALLHDTMPDDLRSLFVDGYALPNPIYRAGSYSPLIPEMIDHMLMPEERKANRLVHTGRLLMLLGLLFDTRSPISAQKLAMSKEAEMLEYLHENFHDPITLTQAAEHLGLSQFQLSRICNHQIGMGFNAYLKSLRVTAAMRRLAFTNKGMQEIALGCGFESVRTFNRAFSEETGISPSEYRRAHQQCTALNLDVNPAPAKKSE